MTDTTRPEHAAIRAPPPPPPAPPMAQAPAGWYADGPRSRRYWDGNAWTAHRAEAPDRVTTGNDLVFAGRQICSPWERFGAFLVDALLVVVTLGIGWMIWALVTGQRGQTPGRNLLGQRVYRLADGRPASLGWMIGMRGIVGWTIFSLSFWVLVGFVLAFMPLWDRRNQTVVDKISSTVVVRCS